MRKLLFITLGTLFITSFIFSANLYQYKKEINQQMNPDNFYFKAQVFNDTETNLDIRYSESGQCGTIDLPVKNGKRFNLNANSNRVIDIVWRLRDRNKIVSTSAGFTINGQAPTNSDPYFWRFYTDQNDKQNHYIQVNDGFICDYGPYIAVKIAIIGDTMFIHIISMKNTNS